MRKVLFLLSLMLVFAVSCGDGKTSSEKKDSDTSDDKTNTTDSADLGDETDLANTVEEADLTDSEKPTEPSEMPEPADGGEHSEVPDEDEESIKPDSDTEPSAEKFCQYACTRASDCIQAATNAITDENNYDCVDRKCVYLGCRSDAECDEVYGAITAATGKVYRCNENGAYGYPECTPECTSAIDCASAETTENAYDLDNYKCENSRCLYAGCNSDSECQLGGLSNMRCLPVKYGEKTLNICSTACSVPADCANTVYSEEVYLCENQLCKIKSCESDEWCAEYIDQKFSCF